MASTFRPRRSAGSAFLAAALGLASFALPASADAQTFPANATWKPLVRGGVRVADPPGDAGSGRDVVSDSAQGAAAAYFAGDANFLYVRLRINDAVLQMPPADFKAFGWVCLIDTDGNLASHELSIGVLGSSDVVELRRNTSPQNDGSPADISETLVKSYPASTHARSVAASTMVSGDADFFIDWAVARVDLGIANQTPFRLACGSSNDAQSLTVDLISDKGALTLAGLVADPIALYGATCLYDCLDSGFPCDVGVGACLATGSILCDGLTRSCDAFPGEPGTETCNGIDDDCNGETDEIFGLGVPCDVGVGACAASGVIVCTSDELLSECSVDPGNPVLEMCNGIDDDCDGLTDENFDVGEACTSGLGACEAVGVKVCSGPATTQCDAQPGIPEAEACNGIDDDCDGVVDNGLGLGDSCTVGVGACLAQGVFVCDALFGTTCNATPGLPSNETCNGVDDDCNGVTDEGCADTDGDGLTDAEEVLLGTDPNDADTDDDGVPDGAEPSMAEDTDGDGLINALDPDSDDDGLFDGTEMGYGCDDPATNLAAMTCVPDGDLGATTTDPTKADTDGGGKPDGAEDADHDGVLDPGETNPNDPSDDAYTCFTDADCGNPVSGSVCEAGACVPGCRGAAGNGCPHGEVCSSSDASRGVCTPAPNECAKDADCGAPGSGRVCDIPARLCQAGCRGAAGNGCPAGSFCTSETSTPGVCAPVPVVGLEGNGVFCEAAGAGRGGRTGGVPFALVVGLSAFVVRRLSREKRRSRGEIEG
ncbi:MopE-related protein [Polyangium mundeleinium]|uniref:MopE-related protein n=1 Tax=Polyangium mundeleinium TaxID=2995306 RepID=A0ABT5EM25_9BACT|nr:MopE-related protein [Polyangium mundeleinium]MDC0742432.1 MopE-related protein [Polyangium mundeleinium]